MSKSVRMCDQKCGGEAWYFASDPSANGWAGYYCGPCSERFVAQGWFRHPYAEKKQEKPERLRFHRVRAGYYEHEDGRYVIYRMDSGHWNICVNTDDDDLRSTGDTGSTLRDAIEQVTWMIARDEDGRPQEDLYR